MTAIEDMLANAQEQPMTLIPVIIPMPVFTFLNEAAIKEGKTVSQLVVETLQRTVAEMAKKHLPKGG